MTIHGPPLQNPTLRPPGRTSRPRSPQADHPLETPRPQEAAGRPPEPLTGRQSPALSHHRRSIQTDRVNPCAPRFSCALTSLSSADVEARLGSRTAQFGRLRLLQPHISLSALSIVHVVIFVRVWNVSSVPEPVYPANVNPFADKAAYEQALSQSADGCIHRKRPEHTRQGPQ